MDLGFVFPSVLCARGGLIPLPLTFGVVAVVFVVVELGDFNFDADGGLIPDC